MTPETPQEIWSSTKWITGVAILREVELGRLELDEPISAHLPYWPTAANDTRSGITLRHLLGFASVSTATLSITTPSSDADRCCHQGYVDVTQTEGYVLPLACLESLQACAERIASELPHPHPPGEVIDYNSVHLTLAGAAVERALQEPIFETIRRNVLVRAGGMPSASFEQHSNANPFRE